MHPDQPIAARIDACRMSARRDCNESTLRGGHAQPGAVQRGIRRVEPIPPFDDPRGSAVNGPRIENRHAILEAFAVSHECRLQGVDLVRIEGWRIFRYGLE